MSRIVMYSNQLSQSRNVMRRRRSIRGMSLVELMVAMAIGLVLTLTVLVSTLTIGRQLQGTGAVAAADVNAQVALSLIDGAARSAGAGLYNRGFPICPRWNAFRAGTVVSNGGVLMPARIVEGGAGPDRIEFTGLTQPNAGLAAPVMVASALPDDGFTVANTAATQLAVGDLAFVGVPPTSAAELASVAPCTLFQVTAVNPDQTACGTNADTCTQLGRAASPWNPASASAAFTTAVTYGFTGVTNAADRPGPAVVQRVGTTFRQDGFTVICNTLVNYDAFVGLPTCTGPTDFSAGTNALAGDVVALHAQYGLAAPATYKVPAVAPAAPQSNVVTQWVDATGAWANPTPGDVVRIQAIRVVVVTRSREPEVGTEVTPATCTNTAVPPVVNNGPCSFDDAEAPEIDVRAVPLPTGRTWRNYRYRVHQSVIPLRNVIWNSAP